MNAMLDLMSGFVMESGQTWGSIATDWQIADATAVLSGDWKYAYLTRPRGGSKTSDVAAMTVAMVLDRIPPGESGHCFAASKDQASLLIGSAAGYVRRTPGLADHIGIQNMRIVNRHNGANVTVMSAESATAYGLRSWWLVVDEIAQWPDTDNSRRLWEAIASTVPKIPDCQLVVISNSGHPASMAGTLMHEAERNPKWYVHQVPGPLAWIPDEVIEQQKRMLMPATYDRLVLNRWTSSDDSLATVDQLQKLFDLDDVTDPQPNIRYVATLDIGTVNDASVLSITHTADGEVFLDKMIVWKGNHTNPVDLQDVENVVGQEAHNYNRSKIVFDPAQSLHIVGRLQDKGHKTQPHVFSATSNHSLAVGLHQSIRHQQLHLYPAEGLLDELAHIRLVETPGSRYRIDHTSGRHDDRAVTLGMAVHYWSMQRRVRRPDYELGKSISWANHAFVERSYWRT